MIRSLQWPTDKLAYSSGRRIPVATASDHTWWWWLRHRLWPYSGRFMEDYLFHHNSWKFLNPSGLRVIGFTLNPEHAKGLNWDNILSPLLRNDTRDTDDASNSTVSENLASGMHHGWSSSAVKLIIYSRSNLVKTAVSGTRGKMMKKYCGKNNLRWRGPGISHVVGTTTSTTSSSGSTSSSRSSNDRNGKSAWSTAPSTSSNTSTSTSTTGTINSGNYTVVSSTPADTAGLAFDHWCPGGSSSRTKISATKTTTSTSAAPNQSMRMPIGQLLGEVQHWQKRYESFHRVIESSHALRQLPTMHVHYEDLQRDQVGTTQKILSFLMHPLSRYGQEKELEAHTHQQVHHWMKRSSDQLQLMITNYHELLSALRSARPSSSSLPPVSPSSTLPVTSSMHRAQSSQTTNCEINMCLYLSEQLEDQNFTVFHPTNGCLPVVAPPPTIKSDTTTSIGTNSGSNGSSTRLTTTTAAAAANSSMNNINSMDSSKSTAFKQAASMTDVCLKEFPQLHTG